MTRTHPADDNLIAYGLGKLADAAAADVLAHLVGCEACKRRVAGLSADSFVGELREGRAADRHAGPSAAARTVSRAEAVHVPPELLALTQYQVARKLGQGGMGVVYLAKDTLTDRLEVPKVTQRAEAGNARFVRDVQDAKLQHPNVASAYAVVHAGNLLVFAMECVEGRDRAELLKVRQEPLPVTTACSYAVAAANGLQHAHERGMIHRDIKPGNLMLAKADCGVPHGLLRGDQGCRDSDAAGATYPSEECERTRL